MFRIAFQSTVKNTRKLAAWTFFRAAVGILLTACVPVTTQKDESQGKAPPSSVSADKLAVVDCVLPSQFIRIGHGPIILKPRRPIKTTVWNCEDRGGEQGISPLEVWLPDAEKGDKVAQTHVGEIYEKGLGIKQDYTHAAEWYRKAAEQGDARAQTNLGFLYEKGLGVPKDQLTALKWQRKAAGLGELALEGDATEAVRLNQELERQKSEAEFLRQQLEQTQRQLEQARQELQLLKGEARVEQQRNIERLEAQLKQSQAEIRAQREEIIRSAKALAPSPPTRTPLPTGLDIGPYHALIIGNSNYTHLDKLQTPVNDAKNLAEILKNKYGFKTTILMDADRDKIAYALEEFRQKLTEKDNFLIYYSGHGQVDRKNRVGFWLPVDAEPDNRVKWFQNEVLAATIDVIQAKHVLVIADSCFSGTLGPPLTTLSPDITPEKLKRVIEILFQKRSRTVFTSGGNEPVLAGGGGEHSVFAKAFLEALNENEGVMEGQALASKVIWRVALAADALEKGYVCVKR